MPVDPLANLKKKPVTWILVADGGHGQVFISSREEHFVPLPGNANHHHYQEKQVKALEAVPDMHFEAEPGDTVEAMKDKRDIAKVMAEKLNAAAQQKRFDQLVLVLPPKMLGLIKEQLDVTTQRMVVAELAKDLAKLESGALARHLQDIA